MAASIQEGQQIPYQNQAASGGTTIQFVQAVLNLSVTPQITPNNKLLLNLLVNQDTPDYTRTGQSGAPAINTRKLQTMIMVNDGQTVVLGGIYQRQDNVNDIRVPYLSKIPLIGNLFKQKTKSQTKSELLIFLTPKIIDTTHDDHDDSESNT
jgi:type IV pilus assembly protein PilQ